jgi:hypothetical protein
MTTADSLDKIYPLTAKNAMSLLHRKPIVPGRNRRVRGEYAALPHRFQIRVDLPRSCRSNNAIVSSDARSRHLVIGAPWTEFSSESMRYPKHAR